jgi:hypothetical protein
MADKNHNFVPDGVEARAAKTLKAIQQSEVRLTTLLKKQRRSASIKHPLAFTILGAFGLVTTFYGFEHVLDNIPLLKNNPVVMLGTGLLLLIVTGSLYKKLGK